MLVLRSALFFLWFVLVTLVIYLGVLPALLLPRRVMVSASRLWSRAVFFGLKIFAGFTYEVRGSVPKTAVLVAAKHMSMWDTMGLYLTLRDPATVLKRELLRIPFYGWYIWKAGVIPVDRGGYASALRKMTTAAKQALQNGRCVLIFPEGTRKAPGAPPDYKAGVAGLYNQLNVACVPVALNSGLFWTGPMGFIKKPGRIVIEFLEVIPPGQRRAEFMALLQERIETATARLIAESRT
jgi:1-acyl-sn-glycerol-3-phosphate acyltransferase